jgi:hypothetical protein
MKVEHDDELATREIRRWADVLGNHEAKRKVLAIMRHPGATAKMFLAGPSGSAKSTLINHACRVAACHSVVADDPCGHCHGCDHFQEKHRDEGLFAILNSGSEANAFHYLYINCRSTTPARLHDELESVRHLDGLRIIHLEEAANLKRLKCDESITDIMDAPGFRECRWFATAVSDEGLDVQFRRRWTAKVVTERPDEGSVVKLLAKVCHERQIEVDHPQTLRIIAKKSWGVVGHAFAVLQNAMSDNPRALTQSSVEKYPLPDKNPWSQTFFSREC